MTWDDFPVTLGRVVSVDPDAGVAMVDVEGAEVPAWLPDHLWLGTETGPAVAAGTTVTLLRMIGGYQMVSAYTGASGGGGPTLGPELLANGGFESGVPGQVPDGWVSFEAGWEVSTDAPLEGSQCVRFVYDTDRTLCTLFRRDAARIDPGKTYRLSGFVSADTTAGSLSARLEVLTGTSATEANYFGPDDGDGSPGALTVVSTLADPGAAWPVLSGDFTVPVDHTYIRVALKAFSAAGTASTVRFDGLSLRQRLA